MVVLKWLSNWRLWAALALVIAALIGVWLLARSRDFQLFGEIVSHVPVEEKVVALTLDDGPSEKYTQPVLDILSEKGVKATFFLIGQEVEQRPDKAKAIMAGGHEIGNHTFAHDDMTLAWTDKAAREVEKTDKAIRDIGYTGDILFRAPFTKKLIGLPLYLAQHNRITITCDVEPESFEEIAADPAKITAHVLEKVKPGSIVLLHVMYESRATSRAALPDVIDGLKARGYRFVTVSELLRMRKKSA